MHSDKVTPMIKETNNIAIMCGERNISYRELLDYINLFAEQTKKDEAQPRTAENLSKTIIFSENREGWIYALYGVWAAGGIVVPVDSSSTVHDLAYIMHDCTPQAIWTTAAHVDVAREAIAEAGVTMDVLMIDDIGVDTYSDERFFSYRRSVHRKQADYGRHVHAIALARE